MFAMPINTDAASKHYISCIDCQKSVIVNARLTELAIHVLSNDATRETVSEKQMGIIQSVKENHAVIKNGRVHLPISIEFIKIPA